VRSRGESEDILEKESGLLSPFLEIFRSEKVLGRRNGDQELVILGEELVMNVCENKVE